MERQYWNDIADNYENEIFDVAANDTKNLIRKQIRKYASPEKQASDLGCGTGNFLKPLSRHFKKVFAADISHKNIKKAKARYPNLTNIKYLTADLSNMKQRLPRTDFALSVNMLIMPQLSVRIKILDFIARHIKKHGHLVLVVPSLESAMLTDFHLIHWNLKDGIAPATAARKGFNAKDNSRIHEGIVYIDSVATKHWLKEELAALLEEHTSSIANF